MRGADLGVRGIHRFFAGHGTALNKQPVCVCVCVCVCVDCLCVRIRAHTYVCLREIKPGVTFVDKELI